MMTIALGKMTAGQPSMNDRDRNFDTYKAIDAACPMNFCIEHQANINENAGEHLETRLAVTPRKMKRQRRIHNTGSGVDDRMPNWLKSSLGSQRAMIDSTHAIASGVAPTESYQAFGPPGQTGSPPGSHAVVDDPSCGSKPLHTR